MISIGADKHADCICLLYLGWGSSRLEGSPPLLRRPIFCLLARGPRTSANHGRRRYKEIKRLSLLWVKYAYEIKE
jgi:hypothetical protein